MTKYAKQKFSWKDWHQETEAAKYKEQIFSITDTPKNTSKIEDLIASL
jgi:hypothetical protein